MNIVAELIGGVVLVSLILLGLDALVRRFNNPSKKRKP